MKWQLSTANFNLKLKSKGKIAGFLISVNSCLFMQRNSWRKGLLVPPALTALVKDVRPGFFQWLAWLSVAVHWDPFSTHRVMHMEDVSHPESSCLMVALNHEGMTDSRRNAWRNEGSRDAEDVLGCGRCPEMQKMPGFKA